MKFHEYRLINKKSIELVNLADIHLGHTCCDQQMLQNVIDFIQKNNCFWIGGGDYGDAIIPTDTRFDYRSIDENLKTPQLQYAKMEELLKPISKKCLGLLDGNHDIIHWKTHQHNYVEELARRLNIPYLTISAYLRLQFDMVEKTDPEENVQKGKCRDACMLAPFAAFNIYTHHGWTTGRTAGARVNRISDLFNIFPMLDLYIMNHVHALGLIEKKTSLYIGNDNTIHDKISHFLYGGSFLKGYVLDQVSYVEEKTYIPTTLGSPVLKITPVKGKHGVNFQIEYKEVR